MAARRLRSGGRSTTILVAFFLFGACAGTERDIRLLEFRELFSRSDGTATQHIVTIGRATVPPVEGEEYEYKGRAHIAHHRVVRSVRALGTTRARTTTELTNIVGALFYVLAGDPTAVARATACGSLGLTAGRLPTEVKAPPTYDPRTPAAIGMLASQVERCARRLEAGEHVEATKILKLLRSLASQYPVDGLSARRMLRTVGSRPIAGTGGPVSEEADRLVPLITRRCIVVVLASAGVGDPVEPGAEPDPSPWVRSEAMDQLARLRSPAARRGAIERLRDPVDPKEHDPDVRRSLYGYLASVPDEQAFEACLRGLDDLDPSLRFAAGAALRRMAGVDLPQSRSECRQLLMELGRIP